MQSLRDSMAVVLQEPLLFPSSLLLAVASAAKVFSPRAILLVMAGGAALAANLLFLRRPRGSPDDAWRGLARVGLLCTAFWIPAYAFGVLGQWWFQRYFFPLFLLMAPASGLVADRIARSRVIGKWMRPAGFVAAAACLHLLLFAWQTPEEFFRTKPFRNVSSYMQAARVLDETLPAGSLGGAFQSGTIGYFARHPVINLDGVVNRDAARALKEKRMADYIREEGIEAIIDWPLWIEALLVRRSPAGAASLGPTRQAGLFLLMRVEPSPGRSGEEPQR